MSLLIGFPSGVLSPYLFNRYIRDMLVELESTQEGCNIGGMFVNVLAYADDIVLLAPAWKALQRFIDVLLVHSRIIDMECNAQKSICVWFVILRIVQKSLVIVILT